MVNIFLGSFPRYIIELLALSSFSLMGAYLSKQSNTNFDVVTVLGAFALAFKAFTILAIHLCKLGIDKGT